MKLNNVLSIFALAVAPLLSGFATTGCSSEDPTEQVDNVVALSVDNVVAVPPVAVPGLDGIALGIVVLGLGGLGTRMALARTRGEVTSS